MLDVNQRVQATPPPEPPSYGVLDRLLLILRFGFRTFIASAILLSFAYPALMLGRLFRYLEGPEVDSVVLAGCKVGEYTIFLSDLILFIVFVFKETVEALREILRPQPPRQP